ncbi:hypothetical protein VPH159E362A_0006 [Vibrio phage 159E36-2a]
METPFRLIRGFFRFRQVRFQMFHVMPGQYRKNP